MYHIFCFFDHQDGKNPISTTQSITSKGNSGKRQKMGSDSQLEVISEVQADTKSKQKESPPFVALDRKRVPWKQLVGESKDSTFSVSQLLPSTDSTKSGRSESCDKSKKTKKVFIQMDEGHSSMSSEVSDALESAEETSSEDNSITEQSENELDNAVIKTSALEESSQELQNKSTSFIDQHQSNENPVSNQFGRGSSWLQKSSWMQLVGGTTNTFSISQLVPDIDKLKSTIPKSYDVDASSKVTKVTSYSNLNSSSKHPKGNKTIRAEKSVGDSDSKKTSPMASNEPDKSQNEPEKLGENCDDTLSTDTGKVCLFMRNADSVMQWTKIRAAVRGKFTKRDQTGSAEGSKKWSKKRKSG